MKRSDKQLLLFEKSARIFLESRSWSEQWPLSRDRLIGKTSGFDDEKCFRLLKPIWLDLYKRTDGPQEVRIEKTNAMIAGLVAMTGSWLEPYKRKGLGTSTHSSVKEYRDETLKNLDDANEAVEVLNRSIKSEDWISEDIRKLIKTATRDFRIAESKFRFQFGFPSKRIRREKWGYEQLCRHFGRAHARAHIRRAIRELPKGTKLLVDPVGWYDRVRKQKVRADAVTNFAVSKVEKVELQPEIDKDLGSYSDKSSNQIPLSNGKTAGVSEIGRAKSRDAQ